MTKLYILAGEAARSHPAMTEKAEAEREQDRGAEREGEGVRSYVI